MKTPGILIQISYSPAAAGTFANYRFVQQVLDHVKPTKIVHGNAFGADTLAGRYAREHGIPCTSYPPDRSLDGPGRDWKFRRNERMLHASKPDSVVAFPGGPRHRPHGQDRQEGRITPSGNSPPQPVPLPTRTVQRDYISQTERPKTHHSAALASRSPQPDRPDIRRRHRIQEPTDPGQRVHQFLRLRHQPLRRLQLRLPVLLRIQLQHHCQEETGLGQVGERQDQRRRADQQRPEGRTKRQKPSTWPPVTDPYQPVERTAKVTQDILEAIASRQPGIKLVIQTRSTLVTRDLALLKSITRQGGKIQVNMTVITDDDDVRKLYEPGCSSIDARLRAIQAVHDHGIQACITMTPMLPMKDPQTFAQQLLQTGIRRFHLPALPLPEPRPWR